MSPPPPPFDPQGRLNELMSQLRLQVHRETSATGTQSGAKVVLEPALLDDIREVSEVATCVHACVP